MYKLSSLRGCAVWPGSIPQRLRSHETFKGQSTHARVRAITYVCIDGLPSNLVQMLSLLRRCSYIQEYLGYLSNKLYFLFSHFWPVVVYNFGTSTVEREKQRSVLKKNKKNNGGRYSHWTALLALTLKAQIPALVGESESVLSASIFNST